MSTGVIDRPKEAEKQYIYAQLQLKAAPEAEENEPLATRWVPADPIREAKLKLLRMGREDEARALDPLIWGDATISAEDRMARAMVSKFWAEDWDSEEDRLYDEP